MLAPCTLEGVERKVVQGFYQQLALLGIRCMRNRKSGLCVGISAMDNHQDLLPEWWKEVILGLGTDEHYIYPSMSMSFCVFCFLFLSSLLTSESASKRIL